MFRDNAPIIKLETVSREICVRRSKALQDGICDEIRIRICDRRSSYPIVFSSSFSAKFIAIFRAGSERFIAERVISHSRERNVFAVNLKSSVFQSPRMSNNVRPGVLPRSPPWSHSNLGRTSRKWLAEQSKSSGTIIRSTPVLFSDTASPYHHYHYRVRSWTTQKSRDICAPLHALSRVAFRDTHSSGRKNHPRKWTRARTGGEAIVRLRREPRSGTESAFLRRCRVIPRKGPQKRSSGGRAPLARTSPPDTTGNATRATRRGEGRGSFETAMLPRRR